MQYKDCIITKTDDGYIIANSAVERIISFINGIPVIVSIKNKISGRVWNSPGHPVAAFTLPVLDFSCCRMTAATSVEDNTPLSDPCLVLEMKFEAPGVTVRWQNCIYPEIPFVNSRLYVSVGDGYTLYPMKDRAVDTPDVLLPPADTIEAFRLNSRHTRLTIAELMDVSDHCNNFVRESTELPYIMWEQSFNGHFFLFDDYLHHEGLLLVKESPCPAGKLQHTREDMQTFNAHYAFLMGSGLNYTTLPQEEILLYQASVGVGSPETLTDQYKTLYRARCGGIRTRGLYMMSNTWGDRNQDKAVCEAFMLAEIKLAAELGIDVVQIDDGWQTGRTANSALVQTDLWSGGYYDTDPDFWVPDKNKFPGGLERIAAEIKANHLQLGLWFSPDLARDYALWQRDADTLVSLHRLYNVLFFKLDGLKITDKQIEINLLKMMRQVTKQTDGKVWFNMDITAQVRLGHLYQPEYGSLFIENRYTDSANYYPHYTLKNLWELSKYIPVAKCQFELLNHHRNDSLYNARFGEEDPLRPSLWPMDTLFACTMLSCPLFWMELSHLPEADVKLLAGIIAVFKQHREQLANGRVKPLGALPDGVSHTGFEIACDEKSGYLLFFREFSPDASFEYPMAFRGRKIDILYTNGDGELTPTDKGLKVTLHKTASFVFARYSAQ